jgi:hypothetical protein
MKTAGALVALACAGLGGCVDLRSLGAGQPDPTLANNLLVDANVLKPNPSDPGNFVDNDGQCGADAKVVTCYWESKALIDYRYQTYKTSLLHAVNSGTFAGDFISLGLNVAGTITPGATAAKLFNALAGAATGTKSLVSQDILYKQTITILISEMDSDRQDEAAKIEQGLAAKPVAQVIDELLAYYETGTFQHALVTLQNKAGTPAAATATAPAAAAQTVITIKPAAGGAPFPARSTFEIKGTVGTSPIDALYTAGAPQTATQVAAGLALLPGLNSNGVTAAASGATITLSYSKTSPVTWTAGGTEAASISIAP